MEPDSPTTKFHCSVLPNRRKMHLEEVAHVPGYTTQLSLFLQMSIRHSTWLALNFAILSQPPGYRNTGTAISGMAHMHSLLAYFLFLLINLQRKASFWISNQISKTEIALYYTSILQGLWNFYCWSHTPLDCIKNQMHPSLYSRLLTMHIFICLT